MPAPEYCPRCGHTGGHGRVHVRHEQGGGGSNRPCPNAPHTLNSKEK